MSAPAVIAEPHLTWCIWTKTGGRPKRFHATREEAENEAARLARKNPGKRFIVMQMVAKFHLPVGAAEYRLMNATVAEQRSRWWSGDQARLTVPTFLQEELRNERHPRAN